MEWIIYIFEKNYIYLAYMDTCGSNLETLQSSRVWPVLRIGRITAQCIRMGIGGAQWRRIRRPRIIRSRHGRTVIPPGALCWDNRPMGILVVVAIIAALRGVGVVRWRCVGTRAGGGCRRGRGRCGYCLGVVILIDRVGSIFVVVIVPVIVA